MYINRYYMDEQIEREDMKKYSIISKPTLEMINKAQSRTPEKDENEK